MWFQNGKGKIEGEGDIGANFGKLYYMATNTA